MLPYKEVVDDPQLLEALIADDTSADHDYRPTPYWQPYAQRIVRELQSTGLKGFRTNQKILKGFGAGGTARPTLPQSRVKRRVWAALVGAPGFRIIVKEYERLISAQSDHLRRVEKAHAREVLEQIALSYPALRIPEGLGNGGADDIFDWRGLPVSADFVQFLARAADFYATVEPSSVESILEVGTGVGWSTLAHVTLNPHLKVIFNLDIVPVIYVSTRFLASFPAVEVMDYSAVRNSTSLVPSVGAKPRIYSLPAWMLPRLAGSVDFAFNAFSFQEMEEESCENYARHLCRLAQKGVMLHSSLEGHKPGAGNQRKPVTMDFLKSQFMGKFTTAEPIAGIWTRAYDSDPATAILMR